MSDCEEVSTPCDRTIYAVRTVKDRTRDEFRSIVGSLSYLCVASLPDTSYVTSYLCRYLVKSSPELLIIAKRVLRYLKGTRALGTTYRSDSVEKTVAFSDADHG